MNARAPVRASTHLCASTRSFFAGSVGRGTAGDARRGGGALPAWRELQRTHRRASPARRGRGAWQWQTVRARLDVAVRPETYREELDVKIERARAHFQSRPADAKNPDGAAEIPLPTTEVFESARQNFRMRAEFRVWHEGDESFLAMFDSDDPKTPVEVPRFPMGSERINQLMPALLEEIKANEVLRKKLFQVNFLTTVKGDALVSASRRSGRRRRTPRAPGSTSPSSVEAASKRCVVLALVRLDAPPRVLALARSARHVPTHFGRGSVVSADDKT